MNWYVFLEGRCDVPQYVCERERERGRGKAPSNLIHVCLSVYTIHNNTVGTDERQPKDATFETLVHQYSTRHVSFFQSEGNNMSCMECEESNAF